MHLSFITSRDLFVDTFRSVASFHSKHIASHLQSKLHFVHCDECHIFLALLHDLHDVCGQIVHSSHSTTSASAAAKKDWREWNDEFTNRTFILVHIHIGLKIYWPPQFSTLQHFHWPHQFGNQNARQIVHALVSHHRRLFIRLISHSISRLFSLQSTIISISIVGHKI